MPRVIVLVSLVLSSSIALAQPPPPPGAGQSSGMWGGTNPGARQHDDFYLRLYFGVGYTRMELPDADVVVGGAGGAFGIAAGFNVSPNLILYGEIFDNLAINPTVEVNGMEATTEDVNAGVVAVGVGLAYYMQPANIYISGTLSYGKLTVQQDGDEIGESDFGPGVSLMVGKEWWVSDNWGLGIAAQLYAGRMDDSDAAGAPTWGTTAFSVALSATYD